MTRRVVQYDNVSGGEFGRHGAYDAPLNSFSGLNMLVTFDGNLTVRPGLKKLPITGMPNGIIRAFGRTNVASADMFFAGGSDGKSVYSFSVTSDNLRGPASTKLTAVPTAPCAWVAVVNDVYITSLAEGSYKISPSAVAIPVVTKLTGVAGGTCISTYQDRIAIGGLTGAGGTSNRIQFSDPSAFTTWPSTNFDDIGDAFDIQAIHPQRGHLLIGKPLGGWYVYNGSPASGSGSAAVAGNETVRQVSHTRNGPTAWPTSTLINADDTVWFVGEGVNWPGLMNGTQPLFLRQLTTIGTPIFNAAAFPPPIGVTEFGGRDSGVVVLTSNSDVSFPYYSLAKINNVWTTHAFGKSTSGWHAAGLDNIIVTTDGGAAGAPANVYAWFASLDRPGFASDSFAQPGDDSTSPVVGTFDLPEWHHPQNNEFKVRTVTVDFTTWNNGASANNHFDFVVRALRTWDATGDPITSATNTFDQAVSSSSTTGTIQRRIFSVGGDIPHGDGFQLSFTNCKGISIQRIQVGLDENEGLRGTNF